MILAPAVPALRRQVVYTLHGHAMQRADEIQAQARLMQQQGLAIPRECGQVLIARRVRQPTPARPVTGRLRQTAEEGLKHLHMLLRCHVQTEQPRPGERRAEQQAAELAMWALPFA